MYKYWSNDSWWAELQIGWHFGLGWEITEYGAFVILPFTRLSAGWL